MESSLGHQNHLRKVDAERTMEEIHRQQKARRYETESKLKDEALLNLESQVGRGTRDQLILFAFLMLFGLQIC